MSLATLTVEVAFEKGLTETAADGDFTTISTANPVVQFRSTRGRGHELEVTQSGTATVICQNTNGYLDPSNESSPSPYYDGGNNVLPGRHIRIKAQDPETSTTYVIFRGFVERWIQKYPNETNQQVVIECADAFKALALAFCDGSSESQEDSGTRIGNLLDQASWPSGAGYRDIDTSGNETVSAKTYATTTATMQACQAIETAEIGSFFVSRSGAMTFKNRTNRISEFATISATLSDTSTASGRVKYYGLDFSFDDTRIFNVINTTLDDGSTTGTQQTDSTSQTRYGIRTKSQTGLMLTTAGEATSWAQYIIGRQSEPASRVKSITLRPDEQAALWAKVLPAEIGNAYVVERTPAAGNEISHTVICERVQHTASGANWVTTMQMSPADTQGYWVLDDGAGTYAAFSRLSETTRLFFG
jgi:hypothetical protein